MLEDLIFKGKTEKEIEIQGNKITIKYLDNDDKIRIFNQVYRNDNIKSQSIAYALEVLSNCVVRVNGKTGTYEENRKVVGQIPESILCEIYSEYEKFEQEVNESIEKGDHLKN